MKNRFAVVCAVIAVMPCSFAMAAGPDSAGMRRDTLSLSLDSCRTLALENNPYILNAGLDVYAARARKQEALAEYFPKVSLNAFAFHAFDPMLELGITDILGESDFSSNLESLLGSLGETYGFNPVYSTLRHGLMANVSVMQPIFAGGRIVNGNRLAALGVEAASLQKNIKTRDISEEVERGYWQIISLEEKLHTLDKMQELVDTLYRDVSAACTAGLAKENDLLQVRLQKNSLRSGKISLKNGIRVAKMNLFNSIGVRYNPYSTIANDSIPYIDDIVLSDRFGTFASPDRYYRPEDEVVANQDETRLLEISVRSVQLEKKMAMGEALPQIGAGVSYGYSELVTDGRMNGAVYASVQIPLSDWGKTARKMQQYDSKLQKARNEKEYLDAQLLLQVRKLWLDLESAWEQLQVAQENVDVARENVRDQTACYKAGMLPVSDLLQAQTQLQEADNEYIDQSIEYVVALNAYLDRTEK